MMDRRNDIPKGTFRDARPIIRIARIAVAFGFNLNWTFDPVTAWKRREPMIRKG